MSNEAIELLVAKAMALDDTSTKVMAATVAGFVCTAAVAKMLQCSYEDAALVLPALNRRIPLEAYAKTMRLAGETLLDVAAKGAGVK